jgi:hypothetical protein
MNVAHNRPFLPVLGCWTALLCSPPAGAQAAGHPVGVTRAPAAAGPGTAHLRRPWTPELTARPSFVLMYRRAPALLARLEDRIGEEAFDRFVERYMTEGVARTEALLEMLGEVAGDEAERWFRGELAEASEG